MAKPATGGTIPAIYSTLPAAAWTAVALLFFVAARSSGKPFGPHAEEHEAEAPEGGAHEGLPPAMSEEHAAPAVHPAKSRLR